MFDDTMDPKDAGLLELTRRLEAYADARLGQSAAGTVSMRAAVMGAAHRRAALIAADTARAAIVVPVVTRRPERSRPTFGRWSRPAAALMTASLALALVTGTAFGAKAGGPLYAARLWIEEANLPAGLLARAQAEGARLDARIAEAQQASVAGDSPATEAALAAYAVIVVEAALGTAGDPTAVAALEISVSRHAVVLDELAGTVPAHARVALENALVASSKATRELDGKSTSGGSHPTGTGSSGGAGPVNPTVSDPPQQSNEPKPPDDGGEVTETPADPEPTAKAPTERETAPPPRQPRGGDPAPTKKPVKPTQAPEPQSGGQNSQAAPGGPSAP